jgi:acyl carrier protein
VEVQEVSSEIAQKVKTMVAERMDVEESKITEDTHFVNDLQADSLDMAELVIDMEEEFGIQISDEEAQKIETVGQAVKYIEEHKKP